MRRFIALLSSVSAVIATSIDTVVYEGASALAVNGTLENPYIVDDVPLNGTLEFQKEYGKKVTRFGDVFMLPEADVFEIVSKGPEEDYIKRNDPWNCGWKFNVQEHCAGQSCNGARKPEWEDYKGRNYTQSNYPKFENTFGTKYRVQFEMGDNCLVRTYHVTYRVNPDPGKQVFHGTVPFA